MCVSGRGCTSARVSERGATHTHTSNWAYHVIASTVPTEGSLYPSQKLQHRKDRDTCWNTPDTPAETRTRWDALDVSRAHDRALNLRPPRLRGGCGVTRLWLVRQVDSTNDDDAGVRGLHRAGGGTKVVKDLHHARLRLLDELPGARAAACPPTHPTSARACTMTQGGGDESSPGHPGEGWDSRRTNEARVDGYLGLGQAVGHEAAAQ